MANTAELLSQIYLTIDGSDAPGDLMRAVQDVTAESSLHLPDTATITLHDPGLRWIDSPLLLPGKSLVVSASGAQRGSSPRPIFDGEIVELEPEFGPGTQVLTVRAFSRLHRLTRGRFVRSFLNVSDGDLVRKIAGEVGLSAEVATTSQVHQYVLQNNETNLEFLRARAAALGYLVYVRGRTLHCGPPKENAGTVALEWGVTLSEFRPRLTTLGQADSVTVRGWDPSSKKEIVGQATNGRGTPAIGESRSGGAMVKSAFNLASPVLVTDQPVRTQAAADLLAQAVADQLAGGYIEAEGSAAGNPSIVAGAALSLRAVGDRFGGTYLVTGATHAYSAAGGYSTHFSATGHHPATLTGLLAPVPERALIPGLVVGIVTDNQDPLNQGRVKVHYPSLSSDHASDWIRLVAPGAGNQRGLELLPEVNDEVLVGFEMGDVHQPYVLGGLWNGKDAPPKTSSQAVSGGKVQLRTIRSRTGHVITLDDADGGGGITIEDSKGNKIGLDTSSNALTIDVQGDASIRAQGRLTLEAQSQVEIKGMGVKVDGGGSTVDVSGSLIKLN